MISLLLFFLLKKICRIRYRIVISAVNMSVETQSIEDLQSEFGENPKDRFGFQETANSINSKTYIIPRTLDIKILKHHLIIAVLTIALIISIIIATYVVRSKVYSQQYSQIANDRSLIIISNNSIWSFDIDTKIQTNLLTASKKITAIDTYLEKTIFWRENSSTTISSIAEEFPGVEHTRRWNPQGIATDYVTQKLYLIDKPSGTLSVIDMNGKHYGVVLSNLHCPHDIALDPVEGVVFIVQFKHSIVKANMDGTGLKTIIEGSAISSLAIDRKAMRIYWANDMASIETSDYEGNNRLVVRQIPMDVASLTVFENHLYWTRSLNYSNLCPCTNVVWSCAMYRRICTNATSHMLSFENPTIVKTFSDQHRHVVKNPCKDNGGCEQLCLLTSDGSHSCACGSGWKLNSDGKSCSEVNELMLYVQGDYVKGRILHPEREEGFLDAIVPTAYYIENLTLKPNIHFNYDMVTGDFFFSDDTSIYKLNVFKDDEQARLLTVSKDFKIRDITYDWIKEEIFFVKESQNKMRNHSIEMLSVKAAGPKLHKVIQTFQFQEEHYVNCPFYLHIHPVHEYLFYAVYANMNDNLQRTSTNGKSLILLNALYGSMYSMLTIDYDTSKLYYATSSDPTLIKSSTFDGGEGAQVRIPNMTNLMFFGIHDDWIYVGNTTEIWAVKKATGDGGKLIVPTTYKDEMDSVNSIHGLKIFSLSGRNKS